VAADEGALFDLRSTLGLGGGVGSMAQPNRTGSALGKLVVDADLIREVPEAGFSTDSIDYYTCA
jgi:hypothetical protein